MALPRAVIDANILFRRYLRDTLLHAAAEGLFVPLWTDAILDEALGHLVRLQHMTQVQADGLRGFLHQHFESAWVEVSPASLATAVTRDPGDRHVLAAAIEEGATVIVTENVRDFPADLLAPHGVTAQTADDFLMTLIVADPAGLARAVQLQQANYRAAPMSLADLLDRLALIVPRAAAALRGQLGA